MLGLDSMTREDMLRFGTPEDLADMGIQLHKYLREKERMILETREI